jgi:hypothetical protein
MDGKRQKDDAFLREWSIPEEDRHKYTSRPWAGEFRRFRSPNIICLEQYRRPRPSTSKAENTRRSSRDARACPLTAGRASMPSVNKS